MGASIASTIDAACELTAYCTTGCMGGVAVDAHALAHRFGAGADLHGRPIQAAIRCRRCGARGVTWQVTPLETRAMGMGYRGPEWASGTTNVGTGSALGIATG